MKKSPKLQIFKAFLGCFFICFAFLSSLLTPITAVHADEQTSGTATVTVENNTSSDESEENDSCSDQLGAIGWVICPATEALAKAIDWGYGKLEQLLIVNPLSSDEDSAIYKIWAIARDIANVAFIIVLIVVVFSQVTGLGVNNYGIKKVLPKIIVAAVLMNLSFLICSLKIEISNIFGKGIYNIFTSIEESTFADAAATYGETGAKIGLGVAGGIAVGIGVLAAEAGLIWMIIPTMLAGALGLLNALIAVVTRQAFIILLVMVAPLAIVANILPNVEQYYQKWKQSLFKMLIFYPMFAVLFGASQLAGSVIMANAGDGLENGFWILAGIAVQLFPLSYSMELMKMSGTILGKISANTSNMLAGLTAKPLATNRAWADSHRRNQNARYIANGQTPSAHLNRYLEKRKTLREEDTKNATRVVAGYSMKYAQNKIAGIRIGEEASKAKANRYTRTAKLAKNYDLETANATANTEHVLSQYGSYYSKNKRDIKLGTQSANAWLDYGRSVHVKDIDDENDIQFLTDKFSAAYQRDANGKPIDEVAFNRYIRSVAGPNGEERVIAKILAQASRVESKQRAEFAILQNKYGHNGYNKQAFRSWAVGYNVNDDGWAIDEHGERLKNADGSYVEIVRGDAITKAPEKLVLYDKRDEYGIYYDMKDQDGNVVSRIHRGKGADGQNHDNAAFIKETFANYDIPISDPINDVYGILAGIRAGSIQTPQGQNEIGLARYSTTIGRAMAEYKGNASWAGAMFNSGIGNRQIQNSAQYAIWVLDSIKKTVKPGGFNTQNPASVEYLTALFNPDNWSKIFTEQDIMNAVNINNDEFGGEDWILDKDGHIVDTVKVDNPTYEQRMNTIKRKLMFPAMKKILPAMDRLRTSNTIDNQKPGTADKLFEFLKMVEDKWEGNSSLPFDVTLVDQDLTSEARDFRSRKHDKNGRPIYTTANHNNHSSTHVNPSLLFEDIYEGASSREELIHDMFAALNSDPRYARALERFDELCRLYPGAGMSEIHDWFEELETLINS